MRTFMLMIRKNEVVQGKGDVSKEDLVFRIILAVEYLILQIRYYLIAEFEEDVKGFQIVY